MRRPKALKLGGLLAALVLPAAAACGIQPTGVTVLGQAPAAQGSTPLTSPGPVDGFQYVLFFYQGDRLAPVYRTSPGTVNEQTVLSALVAGPTGMEVKQGFTSALPPALVAKSRADGYAAAYWLSEPLGSAAKAEFVCTMQNFDGTISVGTLVDGTAKQPTWLGCSDTTNYYVPMQGADTAVGAN